MTTILMKEQNESKRSIVSTHQKQGCRSSPLNSIEVSGCGPVVLMPMASGYQENFCL